MYAFIKFLWYFLSRVLIWAAAVGLIALAFFMAMDYMNASILTKDGLQVRAQVVIEGSDPSTLTKVFSKTFLENDTLINSDAYRPYKVSDFDYSAECNFVLVFPWQSYITLQVTEKVSDISAQVTPESDSGLSPNPPAWENAIYNIKLVRYEGSWRIVSMQKIETLPSSTPYPSPSESSSYSESPSSSESSLFSESPSPSQSPAETETP
jgi:hypothetical protein